MLTATMLPVQSPTKPAQSVEGITTARWFAPTKTGAIQEFVRYDIAKREVIKTDLDTALVMLAVAKRAKRANFVFTLIGANCILLASTDHALARAELPDFD